jgi:hypothetical protein
MNIVNGYVCRNCSDVELAKKGVDPAHPHDGPNGLQPQAPGDRASDGMTQADGSSAPGAQTGYGPAVSFSGALQGPSSIQGSDNSSGHAPAPAWPALQPGQRLNLNA